MRGQNGRFPSKEPPERSNSTSEIAPIPPKRNYKNRLTAAMKDSAELQDNNLSGVTDSASSSSSIVAGAGHNVPRMLGSQSANNTQQKERPRIKPSIPPHQYEDVYIPPTNDLRNYLVSQIPDVIIGDGVEIKGNFQFDGLLRLDGRFQGQFLTEDGDLIVGPTGVLISDITKINRLLIDGGHVFGKIEVAYVTISGRAVVKGNIICKQLEIADSEATIIGNAKIDPNAFDLHEEETLPAHGPKEPIKVISYNKSRSTKTLHEKISPEDIEEILSDSLKQLEQGKQTDAAEAKLEEKRKRKEEKRKKEEEEANTKPSEAKEKTKNQQRREKESEPKQSNVAKQQVEEQKEQERQKNSAKIIQNAWKEKKESKVEDEKTMKEEIGKEEPKAEEPAAEAEKEQPTHEETKPEELLPEAISSEVIPPVSDDVVEELRQKHSAKIIQNAWKLNKTGTKANLDIQTEENLEDSLEVPKPVSDSNSSTKPDESRILQPQEVHLVSGALGSIPQIMIQEKNAETEQVENAEETINEPEEIQPSTEVTENEEVKYGLTNNTDQINEEQEKNSSENVDVE